MRVRGVELTDAEYQSFLKAQEFISGIVNPLDPAIADPEEVFTDAQLENWALNNGFVEKE